MKRRIFAVKLAAAVLSAGLAFSAVPAAVSMGNTSTVYAAKKNGWVKTSSGEKMYYKNGKYVTGVNKIDKKFYYFSADGILQTKDIKNGTIRYYIGADETLLAIKAKKKYCYANGVEMVSADSKEFKTFLKARSIVKKITNNNMSKSDKLLACIKWVQDHPYKLHRNFKAKEDWTATYAMDVFKRGGGDCHSDSAAFGYMAVALGYENVYVCNDSDGTKGLAGGHCWCEIGGRVYDSLFAEGRGFSNYYNVEKTGYYGHPGLHVKLLYLSPQHASGLALVDTSKDGLVQTKGEYYFYKDGKAVRNCWKTVGKNRYYFGEDGKALKGGSYKIIKKYYVFNDKARLMTGKKVRVVTVGATKYRVDKQGIARSGWSGKYFFDASGRRVGGTVVIQEKLYVFGENGKYNESQTDIVQTVCVVDAPMEGVVEVLGEPFSKEYSPTCLPDEEGAEDGTWGYGSFCVITLRRPDGDELYKAVVTDDEVLNETKIPQLR